LVERLYREAADQGSSLDEIVAQHLLRHEPALRGTKSAHASVELGPAADAKTTTDGETAAWLNAELVDSVPAYDWGEALPQSVGQVVRQVPGAGLVVEAEGTVGRTTD